MSEDKTTKHDESVRQDVELLEQELADCRASAQEWEAKFSRVSADLQNYKRRMAQDQLLWSRRSQNDILKSLLSIVDDFDRALQTVGAERADDDWVKGFTLIRSSLEKLLASYDVKPMDNYGAFDPQFHEALVQVDADGHESGAIVEVMQKGYMRNDDVLRPAKVSVAK